MKIIIAGAYAIGTYLAQFLSRNKYDIILIDEQEENLNKIGQNYDLLTLQGKPTSIKVLQEAGVKHAEPLYCGRPQRDHQHNSLHHGTQSRRKKDCG